MITKQGNAPANLTGWRINAGDRYQDFEFPEGTVLQPAQSFKVHTNQIDPQTGGFTFGIGRGIWNDKGDEATLHDADGNVVSYYKY